MTELMTLAGNGMGPGAMKIARGMFESSTVAEYLRQNSSEIKDYLEFTHIIHWKRYQWLLKSSPDVAKQISPEKARELEQHYKQAKVRFTDSKGRMRNQWNQKSIGRMARHVGRGELYELPYSFGASIHHSNYEGMLAYIRIQGQGVILEAPPSMAWVPRALIAGRTFLLQALDTLNECIKLDFEEQIKAGAEDFKKVWASKEQTQA